MPRFSVLMPTYNRADVIGRSIESVRAQTFGDFEFIVVDDGSTDGTKDLIAGSDPRLRVIVQENRGLPGARNTGLAAAKGDLIAFIDSDDEWTPHHLRLASAFFEAFPREHALTSEFWEDFGNQNYLKHFRVETSDWYPETARRIGSSAFTQQPPNGDPYLWFYQQRTEVGDWARDALQESPFPRPHHYSGRIFQGWRWGWLMAMQPTVITRHAMETLGPQDTNSPAASDFGYLAALCREFPMNMLSIPGCIKHEYGIGKKRIAEDHIVTGRAAVRFHREVLRYLDLFYLSAAPDDPELMALRAFRQFLVGKAALSKGERDVALANLSSAARHYPGTDVAALLWLARLIPSGALAALAYRAGLDAAAIPERIRRRAARVLGASGR